MLPLKSLISITVLILTSLAGDSLATTLFSTGAGAFGEPAGTFIAKDNGRDPVTGEVFLAGKEFPAITVPHVDIGNPIHNWATQEGASWVTPFTTFPSDLPLETGCGSSPRCAGNAPEGAYVFSFGFNVQELPDPLNPGRFLETAVNFSFLADNGLDGIGLRSNGRDFSLSTFGATQNQRGTALASVGALTAANSDVPGLPFLGGSADVDVMVTVRNAPGAGFNPRD